MRVCLWSCGCLPSLMNACLSICSPSQCVFAIWSGERCCSFWWSEWGRLNCRMAEWTLESLNIALCLPAVCVCLYSVYLSDYLEGKSWKKKEKSRMYFFLSKIKTSEWDFATSLLPQNENNAVRSSKRLHSGFVDAPRSGAEAISPSRMQDQVRSNSLTDPIKYDKGDAHVKS